MRVDRTRAIVTAAILASTIAACERAAPPTAEQGEMILNALVFSAPPMKADSTMAPDLREAVEGYSRRSAAYVPKPRPVPPDMPEFSMVAPVWADYERRMAAMGDGPQVATLAQEFVDSLRPAYEWEGFHDAPEHDATFADRYQLGHPHGPFVAFLYLFSAHRWLCAAEAYRYEEKPAEEARSRANSEKSLRLALESRSDLVKAAAARLQQRQTCFPKRP